MVIVLETEDTVQNVDGKRIIKMENTNDLLSHLKEALTILTRIDNNLKEVKDTINLMLPIDDVGCNNHRFSKVVGYTGDGGVVFQCKNCKQTEKHYC